MRSSWCDLRWIFFRSIGRCSGFNIRTQRLFTLSHTKYRHETMDALRKQELLSLVKEAIRNYWRKDNPISWNRQERAYPLV